MFRILLDRVGLLRRLDTSGAGDPAVPPEPGIRDVLEVVSGLRNEVQELRQAVYVPSDGIRVPSNQNLASIPYTRAQAPTSIPSFTTPHSLLSFIPSQHGVTVSSTSRGFAIPSPSLERLQPENVAANPPESMTELQYLRMRIEQLERQQNPGTMAPLQPTPLPPSFPTASSPLYHIPAPITPQNMSLSLKNPPAHLPHVDIEPKDLLSDELDVPRQFQRRTIRASDAFPQWKLTKLVWRSTGKKMHNDLMKEGRKCLGVLICNGCGHLKRPKTQISTRDSTQHAIVCDQSRCSSKMYTHRRCGIKTWHWDFERNGELWFAWEHSDQAHDHPCPPGGSALSLAEQTALDQQVALYPDSTPYQLKVGRPGSHSVPLHQISPTLSNGRFLRAQVSKSKSRLGIESHSGAKSAASIFASFAKLQNTHGAFITDSSLHHPQFITLQTPFMKACLVDAVQSWPRDADDLDPASSSVDQDINVSMGRLGSVTDVDNSYFSEGYLIVTCVFCAPIRAWVPVQYTWMGSLDAQHHRPHFRTLFAQIRQAAGPQWNRRVLAQVMDFSAAQRKAFVDEYTDLCMSLITGLDRMSEETQTEARQNIGREAEEFAVGCKIHWQRSIIRLTRNGALVPRSLVSSFEHLTRVLSSDDTSLEAFDQAVIELREGFPAVARWLDWWLQPWVASMIFPAKSSVDPSLRDHIPRTSNPVEAKHSVLHRASGTDKALIPGLEGIFLYVNEIEALYNAVLAGHCPPQTIQPSSRKRTRSWNPNDGRAPDTEDLLAAAATKKGSKSDKSKSSNVKQPSAKRARSTVTKPASTPAQSNTADLSQRVLQGYRWRSPNSCFWDSPLELLYRCFAGLSPAIRRELLEATLPSLANGTKRRGRKPKRSVLQDLVSHFDERNKWVVGSEKAYRSEESGINMLSNMQAVFKELVENTWEIGEPSDPGDPKSARYGTSESVIGKIFSDESVNKAAMPHFGIQHNLIYVCTCGHTLDVSASPPEVRVGFVPEDQDGCRTLLNLTYLNFQDLFDHFIPRRKFGSSYATTLLHTLETTPCTKRRCSHIMQLQSIRTSWPAILQIAPGTNAQPSRPLPRHSMRLKITHSDAPPVEYELLGCIRYHGATPTDGTAPRHYTAHVLHQGRVYSYDGMRNSGRLEEVGSSSVFREHDPLAYTWMYVRTSDIGTSTQGIDQILRHYIAHVPAPTYDQARPEDRFDFSGPDGIPSPKSIAANTALVTQSDSLPTPEDKGSKNNEDDVDIFMLAAIEASVKKAQGLDGSDSSSNRSMSPWPIFCSGCGDEEDGNVVGEDRDTLQCSMCKRYSHTDCIRQHFEDDLPEDAEQINSDEFKWRCPVCRGQPIWDESYVGSIVFLHCNDSIDMLYPARILSAKKGFASLEWLFEFVNWPKSNGLQPSRSFQRTIQECVASRTKVKVESRWLKFPHIILPLCFAEDAVERKYQNHTIAEALDNAALAVIDSTIFSETHPIMDLWLNDNWRRDAMGDPLTQSHITSHKFLNTYRGVPVLPGDLSIMQDTLIAMETYVRHFITRNKKTTLDVDVATHRLHGPAQLLLQLVIVRTYLRRQPEDDDHIYALWMEGRLFRSWILAEVVVAASQGQSEAELNQSGRIGWTHTKADRLFTFAGDLHPSVRPVHVRTDNGSPYIWPAGNGAGLTGASLSVRLVDLAPTGPPPKPRPIKKSKAHSVHFEKQSSPDLEGSHVMMMSEKHGKQDMVEGNSLRRSKRGKHVGTDVQSLA